MDPPVRVVAVVAAAHRHARASSPHGRAGEQPLLPTRRRAAAAATARDEQQRADELTRAPCVGQDLRHRRCARACAVRGRAPGPIRSMRVTRVSFYAHEYELRRLVANLADLRELGLFHSSVRN